MRRAGQLFDQIVDRGNLRLAYWKAARGKRDRTETRDFEAELEPRLQEMRSGLLAGTFPVGRFQQFVIHDPKERVITAPCFEERVLHHAIMNVCEPVFERRLIDDTFACRVGRGRNAALRRAQHFAQGHAYFLKLDIRKYFDSISHARLMESLGVVFKDARLLDWFGRIIHTYRGHHGQGLPIGSLMSQQFANLYLGRFDRYIKETLRVRGYVRYMDDLAIWGDSSQSVRSLTADCAVFLQDELSLEAKPPVVNRTGHGMDFLGCRIFPQRMELNRQSRVRFQRKLRLLEMYRETGAMAEQQIQQRMTSLVAFTRGDVSSWCFRNSAIERLQGHGHKARTG